MAMTRSIGKLVHRDGYIIISCSTLYKKHTMATAVYKMISNVFELLGTDC